MNKNLPIYDYREQIVSAVNDNPVTIISAETGSGKSTQVCQYLGDAVVTEPRRLAAITLAERVAEEEGVELGGEVGYRTAFERRDSEQSKVLFCTDGLQLVRTITETEKRHHLIIDEVHEWNLNIETLVAWVKFKMDSGWNTKVVITSATMETEKLQAYFGKAALLNIPGRTYPVTRFERGANEVISTISELVLAGKNVLVFVPGKKEIDEVISELSSKMLDAELLSLHGELSSEEQKRCFRGYGRPKVVVATNVAQTSVTVPDIDAVVDTGLERRIETDAYGVSGLFLHNISKADSDQRAGRAGRTKAGEYYLCSKVSYEFREDYPVPEIQRSILDQVVLRLAAVGLDATQLEFFHQPSKEALLLAYKSLTNLGALKDGKITELGRKMSRIPLSAKYARMIIEAEKYGVVEDVITIAAILECGSLIDHRSGKGYRNFTTEESSDLLAELDIWNKISKMGYINFKEEGINGKIFFKVKELRQKLVDTLSGIVEFGKEDDRELIKKACFAGMFDNFFATLGWGDYRDVHGNFKSLDKKSVLNKGYSNLIIGKPFTIEYNGRWGDKGTMELIGMATAVEYEWLHEIAPELITVSDSEAEYSESKGCYVWRNIYFNGVVVKQMAVSTPDHPDASRLREEYEESERRRREYIFGSSISSYWNDSFTKRQTSVVVPGSGSFSVEYEDGKPFIWVTREQLKNISAKSVKLNDGQVVTIRCEMYSMNNFPALITKVQNAEIEESRNRVIKSLPNVSSASEAVVVDWFSKLGKTLVAVTWSGEELYEYVYLEFKNNQISVKLTADEEAARVETDEAVRFLFGRIIKSRYPDKKFERKSTFGKVKVNLPEKELFNDLVREAAEGLNTENFSEFFKELMS